MGRTAYTVELSAEEIGSLRNRDEIADQVIGRILNDIAVQVEEKLEDLTDAQDVFLHPAEKK
jgi:hypothetical protein